MLAWPGISTGFPISRSSAPSWTLHSSARAKLAQAHGSESLRDVLEREYQLFTDSINQWTALQGERYERKKVQLSGALEEGRLHLQHKWENAALLSKLKTLEYSLKMQRKRLGLLMEQLHFHQAQMA